MKRSILLARRRRALQSLPPLTEVMRGSVVARRLRCGKPTCHCARTGGHAAIYLSVSVADGRTEQLSLPAPVVPLARRWVANYVRWWRVVERVSAINRELLRQQRAAVTEGRKRRPRRA
jgi:hypothetical protein